MTLGSQKSKVLGMFISQSQRRLSYGGTTFNVIETIIIFLQST